MPGEATVQAEHPRTPGRPRGARIAKLVADDFYGGRLDLASRGMPSNHPWRSMPEVEVLERLWRVHNTKHVALHGGADRFARLFLTFIAAMDRARDATQLWNAGASLYDDCPRPSIHVT